MVLEDQAARQFRTAMRKIIDSAVKSFVAAKWRSGAGLLDNVASRAARE
jgi:hypothetical protein